MKASVEMASKAFKGLEELMCAVKSGLYEPGTVLMMVFKVFSKTLYFRNHIYVSCQIQLHVCPIPYVHDSAILML